MKTSSVAVITARGGSKRIPGKNVREFCGRPIMAYSVEAALESGLFDEVMVSTDSAEIAELARRCGAEVPFLRGAETSNDYAATADVLTEVLTCYRERQGRAFETMCCLYPTAPFVTAEKLQRAAEAFEQSGADSLMAVVRFSFPPQRGMVVRDGVLEYRYPEHARARSQDLEPVYHDCGQFYFCRTAPFLERGTLVLPNTAPFFVPEEEAQDIDTLSDWRLAELKYQRFAAKESERNVSSV